LIASINEKKEAAHDIIANNRTRVPGAHRLHLLLHRGRREAGQLGPRIYSTRKVGELKSEEEGTIRPKRERGRPTFAKGI